MILPDTCDIALCSCFDTADLVSYGQVCRDARRAVKAYSAQAYQLRRTLVNFMGEDDVLTLRKVMRSTGTLISGSVALHYFNRTPVGHSGLDLYIEGGTAMELVSFVLTLGYVYMPRMYQNHDLRTAVKHATYRYAVRDLAIHDLPAILDKISFDRDGTKIHVMIADLSALDAIMDFHSTPVMNFISYRSAYSLYPFHTFVQMFGILLIETIAHNHVDKYRNLGWRIQRSVTQAEYGKIGQELKAPLRYVGDKHTWTIDLDDFADRYLDPVILNSWELQWSYRPLNFIMPQVARMLYIAPRHWIQSRMFATSDLMKAFMVALTRLEPAEKMQTTFDFMDAAFASAQEFLFDSSPPCVTDVIMLGPYQRHYRRARLPVVTFVGDRIEEEEHEAIAGEIILREPALVENAKLPKPSARQPLSCPLPAAHEDLALIRSMAPSTSMSLSAQIQEDLQAADAKDDDEVGSQRASPDDDADNRPRKKARTMADN